MQMQETGQLSTSIDWPTDAIPRRWIESLFHKMWMTYGSKFADQWRTGDARDTEDLKRYWASSLGKYSNQELANGVARLSERDWPPTLPEFEKMCRPPIDAAVAFHEAVTGMQARDRGELGVWSNPAIYWAAMRLGSWDMRNSSYTQVKTRWEHALREAMQEDQAKPIPDALLALPEIGKTITSSEAAEKMLDQVKSSKMLHPENLDEDGRRWARKLQDRIRRGDRNMHFIQFQFVEAVLGKAT